MILGYKLDGYELASRKVVLLLYFCKLFFSFISGFIIPL